MNSFGRLFRIVIFGESHGPEVGVLIDGIPAGVPLTKNDFLHDLQRRQAGAAGTTARRESDQPEIGSGLWQGKTSGTPLLISFLNEDCQSRDYTSCQDIPRPGHADFTALKKFAGYHDFRGGGHFSGRLTLGLVAAGVVAKRIIAPLRVGAQLVEVGGEKEWSSALAQARATGDSLGGLIVCRAKRVPTGLGEPFFDSLESLLSHLLFAIPGIKGVEFGSGFAAARMRGSEHNDMLINRAGKTAGNNAGGCVGGISNGNDLLFRVAVKPTASIALPQKTVRLATGKMSNLKIGGRHDTCFALRLPVVVEAACAIVLADLMLLEQRIGRIWKRK
jgi:chorismate synthase